MKIKHLFLGLLLASALVGCKKEDGKTVAETAVAFDMETAKGAVKASYTEFETAFNAGDATALSNCYTADAKFMQPNDKAIEGRDNIRNMFTDWFKGDKVKIKLNVVEVWGNETNITAENTWVMTAMDGNVVDSGKSLEVYKMEDGKWRLLRDCFNSDLPLMPPPPPAVK